MTALLIAENSALLITDYISFIEPALTINSAMYFDAKMVG